MFKCCYNYFFFIDFTYFWSADCPLVFCAGESEMNYSKTSVDWNNFLRDICQTWVANNPARLGGVRPNLQPIIVEVDETKYFHRKYARGAWHEGHWVVGGIERGNPKNAFLVEVPNRRAETLLPIIQEHCELGSVISTDQWGAYNTIANLPQGYGHITVNHSENFVDPGNPDAHTQSIESFWSHAKKKLKRTNGTSRALFIGYLAEFEWRWRNDTYETADGKAFQKILISINEQYPM